MKHLDTDSGMAGLVETKTATSGFSERFENDFVSAEFVSFPVFVFTCSFARNSSAFELARRRLHEVNLIGRHVIEVERPGGWFLEEVIAIVIWRFDFALLPWCCFPLILMRAPEARVF